MGKGFHKKLLANTVSGLMGLALLTPAIAAPPQIRLLARSQVPPAVGQQVSIQEPGPHLDLRPPALELEASEKPSSFPSARRESVMLQDQDRQPNLGSTELRQHASVQDFVQRVHHEGLPVARLYEGKSALVHLGLSPKGKPGLWLVQKTH